MDILLNFIITLAVTTAITTGQMLTICRIEGSNITDCSVANCSSISLDQGASVACHYCSSKSCTLYTETPVTVSNSCPVYQDPKGMPTEAVTGIVVAVVTAVLWSASVILFMCCKMKSQDVRMKNLKREMAKNKLLMQHSLQPGQLTLNNELGEKGQINQSFELDVEDGSVSPVGSSNSSETPSCEGAACNDSRRESIADEFDQEVEMREGRARNHCRHKNTVISEQEGGVHPPRSTLYEDPWDSEAVMSSLHELTNSLAKQGLVIPAVNGEHEPQQPETE